MTVTSDPETIDNVAVNVKLDPFSATEDALLVNVTVGVLSSSTMLTETELGEPIVAEAPDKELIAITADLFPPETLSSEGLKEVVPVVSPALTVILDRVA